MVKSYAFAVDSASKTAGRRDKFRWCGGFVSVGDLKAFKDTDMRGRVEHHLITVAQRGLWNPVPQLDDASDTAKQMAALRADTVSKTRTVSR